jgi:hypothetical protein
MHAGRGRDGLSLREPFRQPGPPSRDALRRLVATVRLVRRSDSPRSHPDRFVPVVSGLSRTVLSARQRIERSGSRRWSCPGSTAIAAWFVRRAGISLREPCRQPGKTALHFDPDGWSRRSSLVDHPNCERSAAGFAERRCDLRSDRREAPRSAPFLRIQRSDSKRLAARDAVPPMQRVRQRLRMLAQMVCKRVASRTGFEPVGGRLRRNDLRDRGLDRAPTSECAGWSEAGSWAERGVASPFGPRDPWRANNPWPCIRVYVAIDCTD